VLRNAADAVQSEIDPISDVHGSAGYRRRVATVVVRRALTLARDRAKARAG
jgi:CO/xanthine dehydrogenase FAD-binding subunit